jgi:hypothetical protein
MSSTIIIIILDSALSIVILAIMHKIAITWKLYHDILIL